MYLSRNFSWKCHIDLVCKLLFGFSWKCHSICKGTIYKARGYLNTGCLLSILHSLATTHLNYSITRWRKSNFALISKLQGLYDRILRLSFYRHPQENINDIYKNLALLKVKDKCKFEIGCLIHKYLHQMLPECFNNTVQQWSATTGPRLAAGPCEVCYRSVCVFRLNALNLKHFYNIGRNFWTFLKNTL